MPLATGLPTTMHSQPMRAGPVPLSELFKSYWGGGVGVPAPLGLFRFQTCPSLADSLGSSVCLHPVLSKSVHEPLMNSHVPFTLSNLSTPSVRSFIIHPQQSDPPRVPPPVTTHVCVRNTFISYGARPVYRQVRSMEDCLSRGYSYTEHMDSIFYKPHVVASSGSPPAFSVQPLTPITSCATSSLMNSSGGFEPLSPSARPISYDFVPPQCQTLTPTSTVTYAFGKISGLFPSDGSTGPPSEKNEREDVDDDSSDSSTREADSPGGNERTTVQLTEEDIKKIPRDENGNLLSIGSIGHAEGTCKACVFFHDSPKGCTNGAACAFCHFKHPPKKRPMRPSKRQRELAKALQRRHQEQQQRPASSLPFPTPTHLLPVPPPVGQMSIPNFFRPPPPEPFVSRVMFNAPPPPPPAIFAQFVHRPPCGIAFANLPSR